MFDRLGQRVSPRDQARVMPITDKVTSNMMTGWKAQTSPVTRCPRRAKRRPIFTLTRHLGACRQDQNSLPLSITSAVTWPTSSEASTDCYRQSNGGRTCP